MKFYLFGLGCLLLAALSLTQCTRSNADPSATDGSKAMSTAELQQKIAEKTSNPNLQKAFLQKAKEMELIAEGDTEYDEIDRRMTLAGNCSHAIDPDFDAYNMILFLEDTVFNTREKRRLYIKYCAHFSGKVLHGIPGGIVDCKFKVE